MQSVSTRCLDNLEDPHLPPSETVPSKTYTEGQLCDKLRTCLQGERVNLALTHQRYAHMLSFFLCRVNKAARATLVGGLPYLCARVTLAGGLTFSLVHVNTRVNPPMYPG